MTTRTRNRNPRPINAPFAPVLARGSRWVEIACPYCAREHRHEIEPGITSARVAPGCGMVRSPDERLTGYRFVTK